MIALMKKFLVSRKKFMRAVFFMCIGMMFAAADHARAQVPAKPDAPVLVADFGFASDVVVVRWKPAPDATEYHIRFRIKSPLTAWLNSAGPGNSSSECEPHDLEPGCLKGSFSEAGGLVPGVLHQFQIAAANEHGRGDWSDAAEVTPLGTAATPADAPATFTATAGGESIALAWTSSASVFRARWRESDTDAAAGNQPGAWQGWLDDPADADAEYIHGDNDDGVGVTSGAPHAYTIRNLAAGTTYDAQVAAADGGVTGAWSEIKFAAPREIQLPAKLTAPVLAAAAEANINKVEVFWNPSAGDLLAADSHRIRYRVKSPPAQCKPTPIAPRKVWRMIV